MTWGAITKELTVWCGKCGNWNRQNYPTQRAATRRWRSLGWRDTGKGNHSDGKHGWLCRTCYDTYKKEQR